MSTRVVLVCGAGLMGHGIAQVLAVAGHEVRLYEPEQHHAAAGLARIAAALRRAVDNGRLTEPELVAALGRLAVAADLASGVSGVDIVIEAIVEDEAAKSGLFRQLDAVASHDAVLASNTSSLSIERLSAAVRPSRRGQVIGMHFFSPVPAMTLVEVIRGPATNDRAEALVLELVASMGKTALSSADRPGFIVNRMLFPLLAEAMRALEDGVASAADIDAGARLGLGHPMGPLELADRIGLDVCLSILEVLAAGVDTQRFRPPDVLRALVAAGHLGRKSGRGFHVYPT